MTFRIFDDSARKEIADHIHGAPARVQNRYGSNHGTDLLTSQGNPPPYNPDPPGTYTPGGSYPPGGSNGYPPPTGPGGPVGPPQGQLLVCAGTVPLSNDGKCPGPFTRNGKQFHYVKSGEGANAFCCAQEITPGSGPTVQPPGSFPMQSPCPAGSQPHGYYSWKLSETNTPLARGPFSGKSPAQIIEDEKKGCEKFGGTFTVTDTNRNGIDYRTAGCCKQAPVSGPGTTPPIVPPQTGSGPEGPVTTDPYDEAGGGTPEGPSRRTIVLHGRPIQDIAAGQSGWCQITYTMLRFSNDCTKLSGGTLSTSKSTAGLAVDCSKSKDHQIMFYGANPGASVIEKGTPVVAVRDSIGTQSGITYATIVVVPCSS